MLAIDVTFPPESIFIIEVAPYLTSKRPPDSTIEKFAATKLVAFVAFVAFVAVTAKVAFEASPVKLAVIVLAVKLPLASLAIIVEAPLAEAAVVLALAIVPVDMAVPFKAVMFAPENVAELDPVPPEAIGNAVPKVNEVRWVIASTTFVPLLYTYMVLPAGTAIPVPLLFLTVMVSAHPLLTM
jgi:hypothetical protein